MTLPGASAPTEHLLLASLGPVQDFIAAARKCQDLWFGSALLSDLARAGATALASACGQPSAEEALVFPPSVDDASAIANKILVIVAAGTAPADVASAAEKAIRVRLRAISETVFDGIKADERWWSRAVAEEQLADLIEVQWVALPLPSRAKYGAVRTAIELALAARKNTRLWTAVPWHRVGVPKSALDGQRESVLSEKLFDDVGAIGEGKPTIRRRFGVKRAERLCGVALLKRRGQLLAASDDPGTASAPIPRAPFHSNSHIAALPVVQRITSCPEDDPIRREWDTYREWLSGPAGVSLSDFGLKHSGTTLPMLPWTASRGLDGYLLYEDRLAEIIEDANERDPERVRGLVADGRTKLRALMAALKLSAPPAYYTMLLADGDYMGAAFDALAQSGPDALAQHRALSTALDAFARSTGATLREHDGSVIYAGGDDCLALVPVHTTLSCARALAESFTAAIAPLNAILPKPAPTLSVGVAIIHHLDPFVDARELARDAEKLAKKARNSLAVTMSKRSGATVSVTGSWTAPTGQSLDKRIAHWVRHYSAGELPDGLAYEIEDIGTWLATGSGDVDARIKAGTLLAQRVLGRKRADRGRQEMGTTLEADLNSSLSAATTEGCGVDAPFHTLAHELQIARLVASVTETANGSGANPAAAHNPPQEDAA